MRVAALAAVLLTAVHVVSVPALVGGPRPAQVRAVFRRMIRRTGRVFSQPAKANAAVGNGVCCIMRHKTNTTMTLTFEQHPTEMNCRRTTGGNDVLFLVHYQ